MRTNKSFNVILFYCIFMSKHNFTDGSVKCSKYYETSQNILTIAHFLDMFLFETYITLNITIL